MARPWIIIGNPDNRRVGLFQNALSSRGQPTAVVFSYLDLLSGLRHIAEIPPGAIVRIDSPGESFEVEKLLLAAGIEAAGQEHAPTLCAEDLDNLPFDRGRIINTRQWYLGFVRVLHELQACFARRPDLTVCNWPAEIATMFDKAACHRHCQNAGLPVPEVLLDNIGTFDDLITAIDSSGLRRVFIKPAHGSSASGVVALHRRRDEFEAITSAEIVRGHGETRLYNSLKIRRYTDVADVRDLIEALLPHRVHVEKWLPKAALGRAVCDLRVLVIAGEPMHVVVRTSRSPLTNLHLGNRRGDLTKFREQVPAAQWEAALKTCRGAAACFPNSLHLGVDLLFTPNLRKHYVLEINAFGDLLPNVAFEGKNCYEAQVDAILTLTRSRSRHQ